MLESTFGRFIELFILSSSWYNSLTPINPTWMDLQFLNIPSRLKVIIGDAHASSLRNKSEIWLNKYASTVFLLKKCTTSRGGKFFCSTEKREKSLGCQWIHTTTKVAFFYFHNPGQFECIENGNLATHLTQLDLIKLVIQIFMHAHRQIQKNTCILWLVLFSAN